MLEARRLETLSGDLLDFADEIPGAVPDPIRLAHAAATARRRRSEPRPVGG